MKSVVYLIFFSLFSMLWAEKIEIVTVNKPPFVYKEKEQIKGMATQVIRNILMQSKMEYIISEFNWSHSFNLVQNKKNTMMYLLSEKPERKDLFKWVGPIIVPYNMYFYKLKSRSDITMKSLEDAQQYRVGVIENEPNHYYLKKHGFKDGYYLQTVPNVHMNIRKLLKNRVDLIVSNEFTLPILLEKEGLPFNTIEKVYSINKIESGYMAFNKETSIEVIDTIEKAFNHLKLKGRLHDKINLKHLGYHQNKKKELE